MLRPSSFMDFQVWDFPGQLEYLEPSFDLEDIFGSLGALVWVIDAQDDYLDAVARLNRTILTVQQYYPSINIEVLFTKLMACLRSTAPIPSKTLFSVSLIAQWCWVRERSSPLLPTSIYDYSVFEAFSKVIQKLIPQLSTLENLINILANNCGFEKTYLFDVLSKIYIASDTRPVTCLLWDVFRLYRRHCWHFRALFMGSSRPQAEGEQMREAESHVILQDSSMIHLMEMNKWVNIFIERSLQLRLELTMAWF